jgi:hypothetical protein
MAELAKIEKFTSDELDNLRNELLKSKMDSWQLADLVSSFLAGRGYGVDTEIMREAAPRLAIPGGSHESMQALLEAVAYVM